MPRTPYRVRSAHVDDGPSPAPQSGDPRAWVVHMQRLPYTWMWWQCPPQLSGTRGHRGKTPEQGLPAGRPHSCLEPLGWYTDPTGLGLHRAPTPPRAAPIHRPPREPRSSSGQGAGGLVLQAGARTGTEDPRAPQTQCSELLRSRPGDAPKILQELRTPGWRGWGGRDSQANRQATIPTVASGHW